MKLVLVGIPVLKVVPNFKLREEVLSRGQTLSEVIVCLVILNER